MNKFLFDCVSKIGMKVLPIANHLVCNWKYLIFLIMMGVRSYP